MSEKNDNLHEVFGYSELDFEDKTFLEALIDIIMMCEICTRGEIYDETTE